LKVLLKSTNGGKNNAGEPRENERECVDGQDVGQDAIVVLPDVLDGLKWVEK